MDGRLITGRASAAIYLVLAQYANRGSRVLLPANICPAAVYPVLYAGCRPVFCDVDHKTGNVTLATVKAALTGSSSADFAIVPHMFGNPVQDLLEISAFLATRGITLIEDCASAMGARLGNGVDVGSIGDFAVYSFGYSKTVELGFGGMLTGRREKLEPLVNAQLAMPLRSVQALRSEALASRLYRVMLNERKITSFESGLLLGAANALKSVYLVRLDNADVVQVEMAIANLGEIVERRRFEERLYRKCFSQRCVACEMYDFSPDAVPWRFCFTVPQEARQIVIDAMLEADLPISDWYPSIAAFFGDREEYQGAEQLGNSILNLPLMIGESEVKRVATKAADIINRLL